MIRPLTIVLALGLVAPLSAQTSGRARDLGIPLDGTPGALNAITDVAGVAVGHETIVRGSGKLEVGKGPVRTGVTAIFPRGRDDLTPVFAGWFNLNGNGEMTGTAWIEDYGLLVYPITITNTNSVGTVRDAVIEWGRTRLADDFNCCLPVVAETWDGDLSDIYGFHVTKAHAFRALEQRETRSGRGRERRRRDRDDLPRLQGRDRYGEPAARRPGMAGTRSARWSSATSASGDCSASPGCRWGRRSPSRGTATRDPSRTPPAPPSAAPAGDRA